ncbi:NAD-dependent epimerase/dehydratase family protein [Chroogloeocystis siderophila]|uniref:Epimerase n=1 Tax=Chroogloeocystis siderophila 5.2 s.c.1 TaxID=247279 RepID=A0A1U7HYF5_9CHRO|nr:NAD(P)-dependent oxidoreductase [Chroogloeocystis siderophila]OKH28579.1 epimerase [Chroogloeocystis siderophila 5.2 s.c.1]
MYNLAQSNSSLLTPHSSPLAKRILVTGASGCIGHYIGEALIQETCHELYLLVRNPQKLQVDTNYRPGVHVLQGDMQNIRAYTDLLQTIDTAILAATAWGGTDTYDINVTKTQELLSLLSPKCQQVIYFSTASILDRNGNLLPQAGEIGTDYIRSKYDCHQQLSQKEIASKTTILFPTLVIGGDANKPYSHLTSGLPEVTKWVDLIRFFQADGSFHFIHGRDIAQVVRYLVDRPPTAKESQSLVLGQAPLTVNQAVEEVCQYFDKKIYFRIPLTLSLANAIIALFRIQMAAWDRFCLDYRHFTYRNAVNPATFGLPNYCATLSDVLKISGIPPRNKVIKEH